MRIHRRDILKFSAAGGGLIAGAGLLREFGLLRLPPLSRRLLAQQGADYSPLTNWLAAQNPTTTQNSLDYWNGQLVPAFNDLYSPSPVCANCDVETMGDVLNGMVPFYSQTGSPSLDQCVQTCTLINVPPPGSASQVLFQNPTSGPLTGAYNQALGYGYQITQDQVNQRATVPNISTWGSSNWIYPFTTQPMSTLCTNTANAAYAAVTYLAARKTLPPSVCNGLLAGAKGLAFASVAFLGVTVICLGAGNALCAALAYRAAVASITVGAIAVTARAIGGCAPA